MIFLVKSVSGVGRCVYMDNLFSSVDTFKEMLDMKTYACGTTRPHRGMPKDLEKKALKANKTLVDAGDFVFRQGGGGLLPARGSSRLSAGSTRARPSP